MVELGDEAPRGERGSLWIVPGLWKRTEHVSHKVVENRTKRGFPHAPQASAFTMMKKNTGRTMMRPNS
jgi:hypothetical protein